ncbi:hypothetical protein Gotri_023016 [Gossypium trilobum]|uniref:Uncharacterized protein n=1 Tax=Gossypium trilobum TaxID=34281 RepID=A0A7J9DHY2_9ROSI|nr:hypothetical protein [Gossypium trilobum]
MTESSRGLLTRRSFELWCVRNICRTTTNTGTLYPSNFIYSTGI